MDRRGVRKKTYKDVRKEIMEETALNVGYYNGVIKEIPEYLLLETIKDIATNGWITQNTTDMELSNMIITEAVKNMNYQDFKELAPYFFSFSPDDEELYKRTSTIEVTRENYEYLVNNANRAFGLERTLEEIEKERDSLDNKISILETKTVLNGDIVLGVDLEKEELLLLKSPNNVYIDEDIIQDENLINNYRSIDNNDKQILDYLVENYAEIAHIHREYVLNEDKYTGMIDIEEIDYDDIPLSDFNTHKQYYDYAEQYESFNEKYASYEKYIEERFNYIYSLEYVPDYAKEILKEKEQEINNILEEKGKQLIVKEVYGYRQGESWRLAYLSDVEQDTNTIDTYLENYVGAWYRGSLTEVQTVPFDEFEKGKYSGNIDTAYYVDNDLLGVDKLNTIKELYPNLNNFKNIMDIQKEQVKEKEIEKDRSL